MADTKKITISEFVAKYKNLRSAEAKNKLVEGIIKRTYCPISEKKLILQVALDKSVVSREDGVEFIDMYVSKINMTMFTISLYTNLIIDKDDKGNPKSLECYDLLFESEIIDKILVLIGEREMAELNDIYKTIMNTWYNAHSTQNLIVAQVHRLIDKFANGTNDGLGKLASVLSDQNKLNAISNTVKQMKK